MPTQPQWKDRGEAKQRKSTDQPGTRTCNSSPCFRFPLTLQAESCRDAQSRAITPLRPFSLTSTRTNSTCMVWDRNIAEVHSLQSIVAVSMSRVILGCVSVACYRKFLLHRDVCQQRIHTRVSAAAQHAATTEYSRARVQLNSRVSTISKMMWLGRTLSLIHI